MFFYIYAMDAVFTCLGKQMWWTFLKVLGFRVVIHTTLSSRARWEVLTYWN